MNQFSELSLCSQLESNLLQNGFVEMTPVQQQSIPPALAGQDIVATAQTGTGKTLGFVVPMLESLIRGGMTEKMMRSALSRGVQGLHGGV